MKRKTFILLILIGFLILPFRVVADDLKRTFEDKISDHYSSYALFPSYDNKGKMDGYVVMGVYPGCGPGFVYDFVTKYNLNDEKVFSYVFSEHDNLFSTYANGTIVGYLLKDASGNILWQREYGSDIEFFKNYVDYDKNGNIIGYVGLLYTDSTDIDGINPGHIIVKYDKNGNLLWQKNIEFVHDSSYSFRVNSSHFFDLEGNHFFIDGNNVKYYSPTGGLMWEKVIADAGLISPSYFEDKFDGVVAVGFSNYIVKYDLNGNEVFNIPKNIADGDSTSASYILPSRNINGEYDGYMVFLALNGSHKTVLTKYDYQGNIVWSDTIDNISVCSGFMESYDEEGKFNGYVFASVTYGDYPDGAAIVKYTYPKYDIVSDNDRSGVITVSDKALAGEVVKVEVKAKEGYIVKRIVVKDEAGNEIEVSSDGTFVMPEGKVTVSAIYERITNPDTVSACYIVLGIILIISIGTLIITKQKKEEI